LEIENQKKQMEKTLLNNKTTIKNIIKQKWENFKKEQFNEEIIMKYDDIFFKYKQKKTRF